MNIAIVGCGQRGALHAAAAARQGLKIAVCVDKVHARSKTLARAYGSRAVASLRVSVLRSVDLVVVATPSSEHLRPVIAAVKADKHVLCEASLAVTLDECRHVSKLADASNAVVAVVHDTRFRPEYDAIVQRTKTGEIGRVGYIRTYRTVPMPRGSARQYRDRKQNGGTILHGLLHDFDWIEANFGRVRRIFCQRVQKPRLDYAMATLTLDNGVIAQAVGSQVSAVGASPRMKVEVCGQSGMIQFDSAERPITLETHGAAAGAQVHDDDPAIAEALDRLWSDFVEAIRIKGKPVAGVGDGTRAVRMALAALQSAETVNVVRI